MNFKVIDEIENVLSDISIEFLRFEKSPEKLPNDSAFLGVLGLKGILLLEDFTDYEYTSTKAFIKNIQRRYMKSDSFENLPSDLKDRFKSLEKFKNPKTYVFGFFILVLRLSKYMRKEDE